ncbi:long-chain fatty acid transporter [Vibrio sp. 10N.286.49.C2]|uniref:OmpP1/FadL family transporter n=1 Tax=unclassified Vibrio TaxID=2614977 RepID=UPI000C832219|nr:MULTISPECIES: outer membrane protein transport protein [unclassified Vibrio]PMH38850.1 long-chain fatty acid transporter [Vibrio sp. 10N.286.49.C2]PMH55458.1 long-chain fatty acid transporter [Vibrio sp. 10N.286.49.B1]PMH83779.1 long-chain fatty acid transporter [Vibrio sp. 10N.286.48.B7]
MKKTLIASLIITSQVHASGLLLQEAVTANAGTAGAGDGVYTQTASASWTNPATMTHMGEQLTTVNALILDLKLDYDDHSTVPQNGQAKTTMPSIGIFHVRQLTDEIHLGMNFGVVGGSSIEYGTDWAGAPYLNKAFMTGIQINPNLSYKINDHVSLGLGAQINYGLLEVSTSSVQSNLDTDWAYGFNLGAMYHQDNWALGVSYRSKIKHEFSVEASLMTAPYSLPLNTELLIPTIVDISGAYDLNSQLTLLSSVQLHQWSDFDKTPIYTDIGTTNIERNWDDVWKFAIGADYQLTSTWALKVGFSYETSPQDNPSLQWVDLPVGEQYRYSVGASTDWNSTKVDIFYEFADLGTMPITRQVGPNPGPIDGLPDLNGEFSGRIHFVGMNFSF